MNRTLALGAAALTLLVAAGCAGETDAPAAAEEDTPTGAASTSTSAAASPSASDTSSYPGLENFGEPICDAITAADLSKATGVRLERVPDEEDCDFRPVDGSGRVALSDIDEPGKDLGVFADVLRDNSPDAAPVDGDELTLAGLDATRKGKPVSGGAYVRRGDLTVTLVLVLQDGGVADADLLRFTQDVVRLVATKRPGGS